MIFLIASFASMNRRTTQPKMDRRVTLTHWNANRCFGTGYRQAGASEGLDSRERSEEKRNSTQIDHEVVETKGPLAVMNFAKNRKARRSADRQAEALAIFASPNLPSVLPMGTFPLTLVALGDVSRSNFDNMAP
jgi:hypothetical protein